MGEIGGRKRPRILVITGNGKGKTTAAVGMAVRSLAAGKTVLWVRFIKAAPSGELTMLSGMEGMRIVGGGLGMTPPASDPDFSCHAAAARNAFEQARLLSSGFDVIVLDEICGAVAIDLLPESGVIAFLNGLRPDQAAILTGRGAGDSLRAVADTVSEIACMKHGYDQGISAQEGIEF